MTKRVKTRLKQSILAAMMVAAGSFASMMGISAVSSQAHSLAASAIDHKIFYDDARIDAFYESRDMRPVWVRGAGDFQPRLHGVLKILEDSWTHGLNPDVYHVTEIRERLASRDTISDVDIDMLMTDGVVRYVRDLTGMRNKSYVRPDQAVYWRQPMEQEAIYETVVHAADPAQALRKLEPTGNLYNALRRELIRLAAQPEDQFQAVKISKPIKPGKADAAIPVIRARFGVEGGGLDYDDELASKIMTFQREHGLQDDGVIRADVVERLNQSPRERMVQIIANMERLRWLDQDRPQRYVLVNIPSATLWAVNDGKAELEMPVIIGKEARPTYSFKTMITGVRLNPNWTVPPTIKKQDFLPMLQQDPYALAKRGIDLRYNGKSFDPGKVDWHAEGAKYLHKIRMVQAPGDDNPLGKVRVIMENPYNIYLHDTNKREVFDKNERALSSGCIRVAEPEKLAGFILRHNQDMNDEKLSKMISSGRMRDVNVDESIPVYITYQTIWLDTDGRLIYGRDVYGQDKKMAEILEKSKAIHIPSASKNSQISL